LPKSFPEAELEAAAGAAPVERRRVRSSGYGTNSAHWCVDLADGRRAFVKVALDEAAAQWLRQEHRVYSAVEAPFIPELVGWHDGEQTLLAIADLSDAHWPPPWTSGQIDAVRAALDELHATPPPPEEAVSCTEAGVLGPLPALVGALQAAEAVRVLRGEQASFADRLLTMDVWSGTWRSVPLARRLTCAACGPGLGASAATRSIAS